MTSCVAPSLEERLTGRNKMNAARGGSLEKIFMPSCLFPAQLANCSLFYRGEVHLGRGKRKMGIPINILRDSFRVLPFPQIYCREFLLHL